MSIGGEHLSKETQHGIITRGVGGLYGVRTESDEDEVLCRARGILRREHITPTVGDDVIFALATDEDAEDTDSDEVQDTVFASGRREYNKKKSVKVDYVINEILERKSLMIRPPVANLDYLFAVIPCASPEPDLLTADKMTVIAENYGIETVIIVNKSDLSHEKSEGIGHIYEKAGYRVFLISCESGEGIVELRQFIATLPTCAAGVSGKHVSGAFAGVSGAGKSTLMTALFPGLRLKTGEVSHKTERGRHTTRHVELYPIDVGGGVFWLADTPGFSLLDFTRFDFFPYDELASSFREFGDCLTKCRYTKCTHICEDGCAVIEKMKRGGIAQSRHESYVRIYGEQRSVPEWKRR